MLRSAASVCLVLGFLAGLAACDSAPVDPPCIGAACDPLPDPLAVDYDTVTTYDYDTRVRPLLAARNILSTVSTAQRGDPALYAHEAVLAAGPSGFIVPFDTTGSLLLRFVRDLPADTPIPLPNLRRMEPDERRFVARWIAAGARSGHGPGFHESTRLLFAAVQGENHVAILDAATLRIIRRVYFDDHGLPSAPYGPHHVTFEPDGSAWYVSLISGTPTSGGAVVKLSTSLMMDPSDPAYVLGRTPPGAFDTPGMLALDPNSNRLYVGRSTLSDPLASGFGMIDRATMAIQTIATPGFSLPHAMAVTPDGRYVLTASLSGGRAAVYAAGDDPELVSLVDVPGGPHELIHFSVLAPHHHSGRVAANLHEATLTSRSAGTVLFFSLADDGALSFVEAAPAGPGPWHAHVAHDGHTLLIPNRPAGASAATSVTLVDAVTRQTLRTVAHPVLADPHSPAPDHDGTRFFVTSSNLSGAWTPPYLFQRPDGTPTTARDWGNVAAFSMAGEFLGVVQLGASPSGMEPFTVGGGGHHHP